MSRPVARTSDVFIGRCSGHKGHPTVTGIIASGEFPTVEGENMAVTGSIGIGGCAHTCTVIGCSQVVTVNGKPVAREGDPVVGTISGVIVTGAEFFTSD